MTTDQLPLGITLRIAGLALLGWIGLLALVAVLAEPTATVLVMAPQTRVLRAAERADAAVVELHPIVSHLRSDRPGFVRALYAGGAWLVLPSPPGGCLSFDPSPHS